MYELNIRMLYQILSNWFVNKIHMGQLKCSNPFNKLNCLHSATGLFNNNEFTLFTVTLSLLLSLTLSMKSKTSLTVWVIEEEKSDCK